MSSTSDYMNSSGIDSIRFAVNTQEAATDFSIFPEITGSNPFAAKYDKPIKYSGSDRFHQP